MDLSPNTSDLSFLKQTNPALYQSLSAMIDECRYDEAHHEFLNLCRHVKTKTTPQGYPVTAPELAQKGFVKIPNVLAAADINRLREILDFSLHQPTDEDAQAMSEMDGIAEKALNAKVFHRCPLVSPHFYPELEQLIRRCVTPAVAEQIEHTLQSNFYINHYMLSRTYPTTTPITSFLWHRDKTISAQIHIMVYLTDSGPHGERGGTDFLPVRESRILETQFNYKYVEVAKRVANLKDLGVSDEILSKIERPTMKAGDALVFAAPHVLHRGIAPIETPRDAILLVTLPSILPWNESLNRTGIEHMRRRVFGYLSAKQNPSDP